MNANGSKLQVRAEQAAETPAQQQAAARPEGHVFASAEEMLRYDAEHTPVPPVIAERLKESLEREPAPPRSWWQRLFSL